MSRLKTVGRRLIRLQQTTERFRTEKGFKRDACGTFSDAEILNSHLYIVSDDGELPDADDRFIAYTSDEDTLVVYKLSDLRKMRPGDVNVAYERIKAAKKLGIKPVWSAMDINRIGQEFSCRRLAQESIPNSVEHMFVKHFIIRKIVGKMCVKMPEIVKRDIFGFRNSWTPRWFQTMSASGEIDEEAIEIIDRKPRLRVLGMVLYMMLITVMHFTFMPPDQNNVREWITMRTVHLGEEFREAFMPIIEELLACLRECKDKFSWPGRFASCIFSAVHTVLKTLGMDWPWVTDLPSILELDTRNSYKSKDVWVQQFTPIGNMFRSMRSTSDRTYVSYLFECYLKLCPLILSFLSECMDPLFPQIKQFGSFWENRVKPQNIQGLENLMSMTKDLGGATAIETTTLLEFMFSETLLSAGCMNQRSSCAFSKDLMTSFSSVVRRIRRIQEDR